jgi:hypothetical protein
MNKNPIVDKMLSIIPSDPVTQTLYIYTLSWVLFIGLLGYSLATWYGVIMAFNIKSLFSGLFMSAVTLMSLIGLKQARGSYLSIKSFYTKQSEAPQSKEQLEEETKKLMESFKK